VYYYLYILNILYLVPTHASLNKVRFGYCTTAIKRGGSGGGDYPKLFLFSCACGRGGIAKRNGVDPSEAGGADAVAAAVAATFVADRPGRWTVRDEVSGSSEDILYIYFVRSTFAQCRSARAFIPII